jgi:hypothetical protein
VTDHAPETYAVSVPNTELEIAAYTVGGDLCIAINHKNRPCLGRIILENLAQLDLNNTSVAIGDVVLSPISKPERYP